MAFVVVGVFSEVTDLITSGQLFDQRNSPDKRQAAGHKHTDFALPKREPSLPIYKDYTEGQEW